MRQGSWGIIALVLVGCTSGREFSPRLSVETLDSKGKSGFVKFEFEKSRNGHRARGQVTRDAEVKKIAITLTLKGVETASVWDNDYRQSEVDSKPKWIDRWTPQGITVRQKKATWQVEPEGSVQGVWASLQARTLKLTYEIDHADNHPFHLYRDCYETSLPAHPKVNANAQYWKKGEEIDLNIRVQSAPEPSVVLGRWPEGYRAALAMTDHADQSSLGRLKAMGSEWTRRGLGFTKTVFWKPAPGYWAQANWKPYRELLTGLAEKGIRVGWHSVSGGSDTRFDVEVAMLQAASLLKFPMRTWIDHQPDTNCEALTNRGSDPSKTQWYVVDVLEKLGVDYAWSDLDVNRKGLNLWTHGERSPVLYQHRRTGNLWLFTSMWEHVPLRRVLLDYSESRLDQLSAERGFHIGHVYLEQDHDPEHLGAFLEDAPSGGKQLSPGVKEFLDRLQKFQALGKIWVTALEDAADAMRRSAQVRLELLDDRLVVKTGVPMKGVTLLGPGVKRLIPNPPLRACKFDAPEQVCLDLPEAGEYTLGYAGS